MADPTKCQCCRIRNYTRTVMRNHKALKLCDLCETQKPPAKPKKPGKARPTPTVAKRLRRKS